MSLTDLINCETILFLTWSDKCILSNNSKATIFAVAGTKLYVPVVHLSTQDNAKLVKLLKLGFKGAIDWIKYQPKVLPERQNEFLDFLNDPSF